MAEPTPPPSTPGAHHDDAGAVDTLDRDVDETPAGQGAGPMRLLRDARLAWAVAMVAVLVAAFAAYQWRALAAEAEARVQAREAAEIMAARITTFDGAEIDQFVDRLRDLATGDYADQVTELFSPDFRDALRENEIESVGEVVRSFVQELDGDDAEVFVIVRQTSINAAVDEPVTDELRMELSLTREDGRWLIADVAVLGPSAGSLAPSPPQEPGTQP